MNPHLAPSVPLPSTPHTRPQGTGGPPTAAAQHHESGGVLAAFDHGDGQVQRGSGPDDQTPDVTAVDPDQPDRKTAGTGAASSGCAPSQSWALAG